MLSFVTQAETAPKQMDEDIQQLKYKRMMALDTVMVAIYLGFGVPSLVLGIMGDDCSKWMAVFLVVFGVTCLVQVPYRLMVLWPSLACGSKRFPPPKGCGKCMSYMMLLIRLGEVGAWGVIVILVLIEDICNEEAEDFAYVIMIAWPVLVCVWFAGMYLIESRIGF